MAGSFLVHGILLNDGYAQLPNLYRTEDDSASLMPFMLLAHVIMAGAFVWIYRRGAENKPWLAQGLRYGIVIALLAPIPTYMIYYVVQPLPAELVVQQALYDSLLVIVLGMITAAINKPAAPA